MDIVRALQVRQKPVVEVSFYLPRDVIVPVSQCVSRAGSVKEMLEVWKIQILSRFHKDMMARLKVFMKLRGP